MKKTPRWMKIKPKRFQLSLAFNRIGAVQLFWIRVFGDTEKERSSVKPAHMFEIWAREMIKTQTFLAPKSSLISVSSPPKTPTLQRRRVSFGFKEGAERLGSGWKHDTPDYESKTNPLVFRGPGSVSGINQVKMWITTNLIHMGSGCSQSLTGRNLQIIGMLNIILTPYIIQMNV